VSTTPGSGTALGLCLLDFAQKKFTTTLRRSSSPGGDVSVNPPGSDVSITNSAGYYLALEFSSVARNVLYAAGMGNNHKSVIDVYEYNV
jgi:hypothetical protein